MLPMNGTLLSLGAEEVCWCGDLLLSESVAAFARVKHGHAQLCGIQLERMASVVVTGELGRFEASWTNDAVDPTPETQSGNLLGGGSGA